MTPSSAAGFYAKHKLAAFSLLGSKLMENTSDSQSVELTRASFPAARGQAASGAAVHQTAGSVEGAGGLRRRAEGPVAHIGGHLPPGGRRGYKR